MSTKQCVEISCDCLGDCADPLHVKGEECDHLVRFATNSNMVARASAVEFEAWSVTMKQRGPNVYGRSAGLRVDGDRCRACTDWDDPETVIRTAMLAIGYEPDTAVAALLPKVRRLLDQEETS